MAGTLLGLCATSFVAGCTGETGSPDIPSNPGSGGSPSPTDPGSAGRSPAPTDPVFPDMPAPGPATVAVAGERWSDPNTWGGRIPADGDRVTIPGGKTVLVDVDPARLAGLTVRGTLVFADRDVNLTTDFILVERGGRFQLGTTAEPFRRRAVITLTGPTSDEGTFGSKYIGVIDGILDVHGAPAGPSWTKLDREAAAGDTSIVLANAPNWRAGDRLVIGTSSMQMNDYDLVEIAAIEGKNVTLRAPLRHRHFGAVRTVGDARVDVRAEVGLINRNILIQGDEASTSQRVGAHMMFIASQDTTVRLSNIEVTRAGQFNRLGRYPVHFHIMRDLCKGCFVRDVSVHDTIQRGLVVHDTSNVLFENNVVFNTVGHNVIVETESTPGNAFRGNLALVNSKPSPRFTVPMLVAQNDDIPGNYWVKNARNEFTGNHAAGSVGIGFFFDVTSDSPLLFQRNTVHGAMAQGELRDFVIQSGFLLLCGHGDNDTFTSSSKVTDVLIYQNGLSGFWPEQCTNFGPGMQKFEISRLQLIDNGTVNIQLRGQDDFFEITDTLFTQTLLGQRNGSGGLHFQYGGTVNLIRPTFAHMQGEIMGTNDILGPWIARLRIEGARFVDADRARIAAETWNGEGLLEALDDSFLPRGAYITIERPKPTLAGPGCSPRTRDGGTYIYCPVAPVLGFLSILQNVADAGPEGERFGSGTPMHIVSSLLREDGAVFPRTDYGFGGFEVAANTGLSYRLEQEARGRVIVFFYPMGSVTHGIDRDSTVRLVLPMPSSPRGVFHSEANDSAEVRVPGSGDRLSAAASLAALGTNPSSYHYDAAARVLHINAGYRPLVIER